MYSSIVRKGTALTMALLVMTVTHWALPEKTEARQVRNTARANVNRNVNVNQNRNVNRDVNVNRNVNVNRDIDIDVDHDWHGGSYHPVATAAAVTRCAGRVCRVAEGTAGGS
jgi:hypothetical protein